MRNYKEKSSGQKKIALERIETLFGEASDVFKKNKILADRYVELARKIAMKYKVRIPSRLQKQFCKHCYKFLMPNVNCRVRIKKGKVVYYCLECKKYMRFPYNKEKKKQK
jgi:ribonuclease P protein subunit RPR2